jgi:hypothetical protein
MARVKPSISGRFRGSRNQIVVFVVTGARSCGGAVSVRRGVVGEVSIEYEEKRSDPHVADAKRKGLTPMTGRPPHDEDASHQRGGFSTVEVTSGDTTCEERNSSLSPNAGVRSRKGQSETDFATSRRTCVLSTAMLSDVLSRLPREPHPDPTARSLNRSYCESCGSGAKDLESAVEPHQQNRVAAELTFATTDHP